MKKTLLLLGLVLLASCEPTYWDCTQVRITTEGVTTYTEVCYEVEN